MNKKFKKGYNLTLRQKQLIRKRITKIFLRRYKSPVLVHSTPSLKLFKKILKDDALKLPKNKKNDQHMYMERLLNLYPSIFFSLGFQYFSSYNFKYGLIFDLKLLKNAVYLQKSLGFQCYREAFRYWEKHSPEYVEKLKNRGKRCREVVNTYYNYKFNGKTQRIFEFWKIEKELIHLIERYPKKKELIKIFKKIKKDLNKKYPYSIRVAKADYDENYSPEIISRKGIKLSNNDTFLGFHIDGTISKGIEKKLKEKYPGKIIFDGRKIRKIGE